MKIMERGQITIPKKFRKQYGINRETELDIVPIKEGILIIKAKNKKSPIKEVYGILKKKENSDSYIEQIRGR
jgi:AbrB family looped-hinge helix DNA binding protein